MLKWENDYFAYFGFGKLWTFKLDFEGTFQFPFTQGGGSSI